MHRCYNPYNYESGQFQAPVDSCPSPQDNRSSKQLPEVCHLYSLRYFQTSSSRPGKCAVVRTNALFRERPFRLYCNPEKIRPARWMRGYCIRQTYRQKQGPKLERKAGKGRSLGRKWLSWAECKTPGECWEGFPGEQWDLWDLFGNRGLEQSSHLCGE